MLKGFAESRHSIIPYHFTTWIRPMQQEAALKHRTAYRVKALYVQISDVIAQKNNIQRRNGKLRTITIPIFLHIRRLWKICRFQKFTRHITYTKQ